MAGGYSTTTMAPDDYVDGNSALFQRRRELQQQLAELDQEIAGQRVGVRLRRSIEDVTAEIVRFNLGLVRSYCKRFTANSTRDDSADFEAAGLLGLMRAIDSFDPEQGRFGQWAFKPIQREVLRAVRDADHPNVNLGDFERRPEILRAFRHLQGEDDRYNPSHAEVATVVGATIDQVRRVLVPPKLESVDQAASEQNDVTLGDTIESTTPGPETVVVSSMMLSALRTHGLAALDPRELFVIVRRFGLDGEPPEKLAGIGETLGLSREAVRQIEAKAVAKIQHPMVLRKIQRHGRG
ncbi:MAG: polymerase sigma factor RpoD [Ilumatobacteraceae bacterium]|nr:polymerase sigma factor RpoD [Ilumatobacteraceae bacterium]